MVRPLILAVALLSLGALAALAKGRVISTPPAEIPSLTGRWELDLNRT